MLPTFTVSQAAERTGWSPRMLRYVERVGLVAFLDAIRQLLDTNLVPADFQFLRDQHWQRGAHALSDLAAASPDDDAVVRIDAYEDSQRHGPCRRRGVGARHRRQAE